VSLRQVLLAGRASSVGGFVSAFPLFAFRFRFISVFICVHLWLNKFSFIGILVPFKKFLCPQDKNRAAFRPFLRFQISDLAFFVPTLLAFSKNARSRGTESYGRGDRLAISLTDTKP